MYKALPLAIFFHRFIFDNFFLFLLIYSGSGLKILGLGLRLDFWGWGFQLMGFGACGEGPTGFLRVGALYINIEE